MFPPRDRCHGYSRRARGRHSRQTAGVRRPATHSGRRSVGWRRGWLWATAWLRHTGRSGNGTGSRTRRRRYAPGGAHGLRRYAGTRSSDWSRGHRKHWGRRGRGWTRPSMARGGGAEFAERDAFAEFADGERLCHHADSRLGGSTGRGPRHRRRWAASASATHSRTLTSSSSAASLTARCSRRGTRVPSCRRLLSTRGMGGSFRVGRREVGGEQEGLGRTLVGGRNGAEAGKPFLRPEPRGALVLPEEPGVVLPGLRRDDVIGDPGRDEEPEPQAKPDARAIARGDPLPRPGPLRLEGDGDRMNRHGPAIDGAGQELAHGDGVVVEAPLAVAQHLDPRRAVELGGKGVPVLLEVEDGEAAGHAAVNSDNPPHGRP